MSRMKEPDVLAIRSKSSKLRILCLLQLAISSDKISLLNLTCLTADIAVHPHCFTEIHFDMNVVSQTWQRFFADLCRMLTDKDSWHSRHKTGIDREIIKLQEHLGLGDLIEVALIELGEERTTCITMSWVKFMDLVYSLMFGKDRTKHKFTGKTSLIRIGIWAIVRTPTGYTTKAMFIRSPYKYQRDVPLLFLRDALDEMLKKGECTVCEKFTSKAPFDKCDQLDSLSRRQVPLQVQMVLEEIKDILGDSNYMRKIVS